MAFVYSGRPTGCCTGSRRLTRPTCSATAPGSTEDVNRDRVPDLIVGGGGTAYVFSGRDGRKLYALPPSAAARQFGTFFVAGVGDVNHDHVPDVYGADYAAGRQRARTAASRASTPGATARCCAPGPARPATASARAAARATSTATTGPTSRSAPT